MADKNRRGASVRTRRQLSNTPWWQVILPCSRTCGPHQSRFERVFKTVQADDANEAITMCARMLSSAMRIVGVPHAHQRDTRFSPTDHVLPGELAAMKNEAVTRWLAS